MTRYTPLWEQAGTYAAGIDRRLLAALWPGPAVTGCVVSVVGGTMTLNIAPGAVAVPTQNATGTTLCVSDAVEQVVIAAAPTTAGQSRLDIVTCHPRATDIDGGANNDWIFDIIQGVPAASPVAPVVPAGQVPVCQVTVAYNVAALVAGNLTDVRPTPLGLAVPPIGDAAWTNVTAFTGGWTAGGQAPGYILIGRVVYLRGGINPGTSGATAFTLPPGYRPTNSSWYPCTGTATTSVQVNVNTPGTVAPQAASSLSLNAISFPIV